MHEKFSIDGEPVNLIRTDPGQNVYKAAEKMLLANASKELVDGECGVFESSTFYFRDLVLGVWPLLEYIMDKGIKKKASADPTIRVAAKRSLRAWEFMDLIDGIPSIWQKEADIKKGSDDWPDLVQDINTIVFFASGFEDIIMPVKDSKSSIYYP